FYHLSAYFNNIDESGGVDRRGNSAPVLSLATPEQTRKVEELTKALRDAEEVRNLTTKNLTAVQDEWEERVIDDPKNPRNIAAILKTPADKRDDKQKQEVVKHYLAQFPEHAALAKQVELTKKTLDDVNKSILQTMVMEEKSPPRDTFILIR